MAKQTIPCTMSNDKTDCEKICIIEYSKYIKNSHKLSCTFPIYMVV